MSENHEKTAREQLLFFIFLVLTTKSSAKVLKILLIDPLLIIKPQKKYIRQTKC